MRRPASAKFLAKVIEVEDGCWGWWGSITHGYTTFRVCGKNIYGHRFSYEFFVGSIPEGLEIDHLCKNKSCVNPNHLEAVTHKENIWRATRQGDCIRGHGWKNVYIVKSNGERQCIDCKKEVFKHWKIRQQFLYGLHVLNSV